MPKSPYEILGVAETATPKEIKDAYRNLAKKNHPDMQGGKQDEFTKIEKAYKLLSDKKRRDLYDALHGIAKGSQQQQQNTTTPAWSTMAGSSGSIGWSPSPQQRAQFVNSMWQQASFNSTSVPQRTRQAFFIPRQAILTAKVTSMPTFNPTLSTQHIPQPMGTVDEIEIEIDTRFFSEYPMPNDMAKLEFAPFAGSPMSAVETIILESNYSATSIGGIEGRLRVRRIGSWMP